MEGTIVLETNQLIVPVLPITRQRLSRLKQFPSRIAHRHEGLARVAATSRDGLIGGGL